uniref:Peptidase_M1 domain-containing protein n=1 Tax=Heterorhabditis bacteriophora TaxID=37862 RepID=A0A1I7WTS2_HETBA
MPTPASVNLLYDEGQSETQAEIATWAISQSPNRRSSAGLCAAIFVTFLMFILGVLLGAFLHAIAFPDGDSPLDFLSSDLSNETIAYIPYEKEEELNTSKVATRNQEKCNAFPWHDIRLPRHLQPQSYNLTIHPNIEINKLTGSVAIDIKVINSTKLIILHADNLNMLTFYISTNGRKIESDFFACSETSQWALVMEETVEAGDEVDLRIEFEGEVLPDLQGLYISTHTDKSRSAVTQFEPSYARKMFPCFDEPNFKATFEVSVVRGPSQIVRSNMNLKISREHVDGLYIDVFHRTVKMSTYLLAVAVLSNYDYVKRTTSMSEKPMEVRLYAPRDIIKGQSEFGLDTAIRALKYFETYFNISYPLDKIDLLALDDFSEGAMENWGLVTFRDSALLHAESTASGLAKEQIALVICHEMAHQWFGNLVTMDWWNDLWLNEGFANYMEYKCVDHLFPHWNIMTRFYAENVAYSQDPDGLRSSHAISSGMRNNTNIMGLFDAISYHKAAAIIYMMQGLAGEKNFQKALIEYLNKYAYDNAKGAQLWKIVEKNVHLPNGVSIQNLANAFISQVGYPVIYVTLETDNEIVVHNQTRFFFEEGRKDEESEWPIPIHYRTNSQSDPKLVWIKPGQGRVILVSWTIAEPVKWVIANTGGLGYFKVLYDRRIYKEITKQLREDHTLLLIKSTFVKDYLRYRQIDDFGGRIRFCKNIFC